MITFSEILNKLKRFKNLEEFNISTYDDADIVKEYSELRDLYKPEKNILDFLKPNLKNMKMLDIGVGAGRTTLHFADLTQEYVGIDVSEKMIKVCKERFANKNKHLSFQVCNARNLKIFEDNYFDFILFSFNGIDYLDHPGRLEALREIKRVGKQGSLFSFSSHNIYSLKKQFSISFSENPRYLLKLPIIKLLNKSPEKLEQMEYAIINDGVYLFRLMTYYIKPESQIEQLTDLGFKNIKIYSVEEAKEIETSSNLSYVQDGWLYYLCNINKA